MFLFRLLRALNTCLANSLSFICRIECFNVVKGFIPQIYSNIEYSHSIPKCCFAQVLLFGYLGTRKVMLPVILISLALLSITMQMKLTDSSMKRVEVARAEIWLNCHRSLLATHSFMCINWQKCIFYTDVALLYSTSLPPYCWKEKKQSEEIYNTTFQKRICCSACSRTFGGLNLRREAVSVHSGDSI